MLTLPTASKSISFIKRLTIWIRKERSIRLSKGFGSIPGRRPISSRCAQKLIFVKVENFPNPHVNADDDFPEKRAGDGNRTRL